MTMTKVFASFAIVAAAGASTARADFRWFDQRCSPGAIRTCASLQVQTTLLGGGGTSVLIRVRNLAGSFASDNTGGSIISRIGIVAPTIVLGSNALSVTAVGGATQTGAAASKWFLRSPGGLGNMIELTAGITSGTRSGGIEGCSTPSGGHPATYFATCGAGGWVEFAFSTTNNWSANNAEVAWLVQDMNANSGRTAIECGSNYSGQAREWCTGVTPEPITMVLLGSGLAGMGGFGLTRRRKKDEQVS